MEIAMLPAAAGSDGALVGVLTDLVNVVYAAAEKGLWRDGTPRTTEAEMAALVGAGQLAVARLDGGIAGSVRVQELAGGVGEFGMLAADPDRRGLGIGSRLVAFAEDRSRTRGLSTMRLELLVPREWSHPSKEFLHAWYTRLGYRVVHTGTIDEQYPDLAPHLATPCDYRTYHKPLAQPAWPGRGGPDSVGGRG